MARDPYDRHVTGELIIVNGRVLGAGAAHADHRRGRVAPGMDGDVVILDRDLPTAGPSAIIGTSVRLTVLGGRIVHRSEELT